MALTLTLEPRLTTAEQRVNYVQQQLSKLQEVLAPYSGLFVSALLAQSIDDDDYERKGRFKFKTFKTIGSDYASGSWQREAAFEIDNGHLNLVALRGDYPDDVLSFDKNVHSFGTMLDVDIVSFNSALTYATQHLQTLINRKVKEENKIVEG